VELENDMKARSVSSVSIQGPVFRCYGVAVGFRSNSERLLAVIDANFIPASQISKCNRPDLEYSLEVDERDGQYKAYIGSQELIETPDLSRLLDALKVHVQHAVAETAVEHLFVHAGAVSWRGKAILLPGRSGGGKSTLVRDLISAGAEYLSDEFAVLDEEGLVHPFARPLSLRTPLGRTECRPCDLGGQTAIQAMPVGAVVFTTFRPEGTFRPACVTGGRAVLELLKHVIAIRAHPGKAMRIARLVTSTSLVLTSVRGEAQSTTAVLLDVVDNWMASNINQENEQTGELNAHPTC
jgi:hypothetical protein